MTISYIFIFSLNNSGTTAMSQYLEANLDNSYLPPFGNNEGQVVPKVKNIMRNKKVWDPKSYFDWKTIKNYWDEIAIASGKSIFIEASPPNMMRVKSILQTFKNSKYIFSISSPYSYVSSTLYNYEYSFKKTKTIKIINELDFNQAIIKKTENWIKRATVQRKNIETFGRRGQRTSYEEFCAKPDTFLKKLNINPKEIKHNTFLKKLNINPKEIKHKVPHISGKKNTKVKEIIDMLPKHLSFLGLGGIQAVNSILVRHQELIDFFGYKPLSIKDANIILSENFLLALEGQDRRREKRILT